MTNDTKYIEFPSKVYHCLGCVLCYSCDSNYNIVAFRFFNFNSLHGISH